MSNIVKLVETEVIHFMEEVDGKQHPVIIVYGLGQDGILYELSAGLWSAFPVDTTQLRKLKPIPRELIE